MVSLSNILPRDASGAVDIEAWKSRLNLTDQPLDLDEIERALKVLQSRAGVPELEQGLQMANLVRDLNLDADSILVALFYRAVRSEQLSLAEASAHLSNDAAKILAAVLRMASVRLLRLSNTRMQTSEARDQIANVRGMVAALIDDVRVALIKLADRVVALRCAKTSPRQRQIRIADECQRIFAPMAGRLGVWHLKWELEDLSLRYLDPDAYRNIARQLDGRRAERERRVRDVAADLEQMLSARGLRVKVQGRAKHIFSIWRKMQIKQRTFKEVYDVRAVRVLLPNIAECYTALGLIHTRWQHIPSEFDDYIAVPKDNGYRSIHTAVRDDDGAPLEVQIRTYEMHQEAELGVCAHWAYKDDPGALVAHPEVRPDDLYAEKMNWLRQTLEWPDAEAWSDGLATLLDSPGSDTRVFVSTPAGHVIDLVQGATVVDFAYRIHTEIGHRCIGALVDGRPVPLNLRLANGQRVEIITADEPAPPMRWLDFPLGFISTERARDKVQSFWRAMPRARVVAGARARYARLLTQLRWPEPPDEALAAAAAAMGAHDVETLFQLIGVGELSLFDLILLLADWSGSLPATAQRNTAAHASLAGRSETLRADVVVHGENRDGLLRDVALLLGQQHVSLRSTHAEVDEDSSQARICLTLDLGTFVELLRVLELLPQVPGVVEVQALDLTHVPGGVVR